MVNTRLSFATILNVTEHSNHRIPPAFVFLLGGRSSGALGTVGETWVGTTDNKWGTNDSENNNWSGGCPSAAGHAATFGGGGPGAVELPDSLTIGRLALTGGSYALGLTDTATDTLTMDNGPDHAEIKATAGTHTIHAAVADAMTVAGDVAARAGDPGAGWHWPAGPAGLPPAALTRT